MLSLRDLSFTDPRLSTRLGNARHVTITTDSFVYEKLEASAVQYYLTAARLRSVVLADQMSSILSTWQQVFQFGNRVAHPFKALIYSRRYEHFTRAAVPFDE